MFGYGGAIPSHYVWEGNRPASFLGPWQFLWSIGSDLRQFVSFYTGRLDDEVAAVRAALELPSTATEPTATEPIATEPIATEPIATEPRVATA